MRIFLYVLILSFALTAQNIKSGPMLGYAEMREAAIWLQLDNEADVSIKFYEETKPKSAIFIDKQKAEKKKHYILKFIASPLEPGKKYNYEIFINKKKISFNYPLSFHAQDLWQWRKDAPDFKFIAGSCFYINEEQYDRPGKAYGGNFEIIKHMIDKKADMMLWLGDNTYLREADWYSETGIYHRYSHTRSTPALQALLANVHHYAIWDDHDFGPNDADKSFIKKNLTLQAFKDFWINPAYGIDNSGGIFYSFEWNDVQFFMLDNRFFRDANYRQSGAKDYFGKIQYEWLMNQLKFSKSPFKVICNGGQVLNELKIFEQLSNYEREYNQLIDGIKAEKIEGVLFISGDIHRSEIIKMEQENYYPLYEISASSITAGSYPAKKETTSKYVIPESICNVNNFVLVDVNGKRKERQLLIKIIRHDGVEHFSYTIHENELKLKK